jgi:hypothetical protein
LVIIQEGKFSHPEGFLFDTLPSSKKAGGKI